MIGHVSIRNPDPAQLDAEVWAICLKGETLTAAGHSHSIQIGPRLVDSSHTNTPSGPAEFDHGSTCAVGSLAVAAGFSVDSGEGTLFRNYPTSTFRGWHYAFLVSEQEFDEIFGRIQRAGIAYYADPWHRRPGEINHNDGGRGAYFADPNGHNLEIITRPYGSGG